jgi:hypothetical protein
MNLLIESSRANSRRRRCRHSRRLASRAAAALAALLVPSLSAGIIGAAPTISKVTGEDAASQPANQAETGINISAIGGDSRVETVTYNDETGEVGPFVTYSLTSRSIFPGYSLMGWSSRTRTTANPEPPWNHAKLRPPAGAAVLWGDPSITSHAGLPNVVLMTSLMAPTAKFPLPFFDGSAAIGCSPLGGACVARSTDGGVTFSPVNCFSDTRDTGVNTCPAPFEPTKGHFFDGSSSAITKVGTTFVGFVSFVDTDLHRESVWKMDDVTSAPAHPFVRDPSRLGAMGDTGDDGLHGDLAEIGTHERLRADGADLWKMSRDGTDLKVNIHGQNRMFTVAAENVETQGFNVSFPPDSVMRPVVVRTGPQFAFDIGLNEAGQREMRFIYAAREGNQSFMQGGFCTIDLSHCEQPMAWRFPPAGRPVEFHPTIKFGVNDPATGRGSWRVTVDAIRQDNGVSVFSGDLIGSATTPFVATALVPIAVTDSVPPCPDLRISSNNSSSGYWGDYDDMAFDPISKTFVRAFTDSSRLCTFREQFTSTNVHVSTVETPPAARRLNIVGTLVQLRDIDNCPPCDSTLDNLPIEFHLPITAPTPPVVQGYDQCLSGDVKLRIEFHATLSPVDLQTVHVCVSQGIKENSGALNDNVCDNNVDQSTQVCVDLAPGASTGFDDGGLEIHDFATARWNVVITNGS